MALRERTWTEPRFTRLEPSQEDGWTHARERGAHVVRREHGLFAGRFDPYDILAYAMGVGACYSAEKWLGRAPKPVSLPVEP